MKIGIIAAMPEELKILVENLENAEKHLRLGHVYHTEVSVVMKLCWWKAGLERSCLL